MGSNNIVALKNELEITDRLLNERQKVLNAIPECPVHGQGCVPHALEWIEKAKTDMDALQNIRNFLGNN